MVFANPVTIIVKAIYVGGSKAPTVFYFYKATSVLYGKLRTAVTV